MFDSIVKVIGTIGECLIGLTLLWVCWEAWRALYGNRNAKDELRYALGMSVAVVVGGAYEWVLLQQPYLLCTVAPLALVIVMLVVKTPDELEK